LGGDLAEERKESHTICLFYQFTGMVHQKCSPAVLMVLLLIKALKND